MSLTCTASFEDLQGALPQTALYKDASQASDAGVGWLLSPTPYGLTDSQVDLLHKIGPCLYQFSQAIDTLYKSSLKDPELQWVQALFHAGKPESLVKFGQMKRFKSSLPLVIRPDLLVTEKGFSLCEIDAVPGGIGFTGALHQAYQALGFELVGSKAGIPKAFLQMLKDAAPDEAGQNPMIAVVVSDEASDYRQELQWLVESIQAFYPDIALLHPKELLLERNNLGFLDSQGNFQPIQALYRFFELFDLPNIPQIELIQYAVKKGLVFCTPPFKPYLEEKFTLALLHHPFLEAFWLSSLGSESFDLLKSLVPESWILDPAEVPAHAAVVPELRFKEMRLQDYTKLGTLTQKQRELVIKPSGFSPLAWGSRGVKVGHDLSQAQWQNSIQEAFDQFAQTPYILQRFENTQVEPYTYYSPSTKELVEGQGRTRLCPYYFVNKDAVELVSILATTCPKDKKVIHGMRDGVMRPAMVLGKNR